MPYRQSVFPSLGHVRDWRNWIIRTRLANPVVLAVLSGAVAEGIIHALTSFVKSKKPFVATQCSQSPVRQRIFLGRIVPEESGGGGWTRSNEMQEHRNS
jgi:hypothetical protein